MEEQAQRSNESPLSGGLDALPEEHEGNLEEQLHGFQAQAVLEADLEMEYEGAFDDAEEVRYMLVVGTLASLL